MKNLFTLFIACMLSITAMAQVITSGLVAYYPFNGNANDMSGNGNNGIVRGATLTTDRFGSTNSAYSFNGTSSSIVIPNSSSFNFSSDKITISFWMKTTNYPSGSGIYNLISKYSGTGTTTSGFIIYLWNSNLAYQYADATTTGGWGLVQVPYSNLPTVGTWFHVAVTTNTGFDKLYINGILVDSNSTQNNFDIGSVTDSLMLGAGPYQNPGLYYNGNLDDIRIYDRALNKSEITALYNETPCYAPTPSTNNVTLSNPGTATLTATGGTNYKWYNVATGGTVLGTSASFTTPVVNTCDTFWVSNTTTCESNRVPAIVSVVNLSTGLVAMYPFNGNANDMSGNGNNGVVTGATLTTDRFGNPNSAYYFPGSNSVITVPNNSSLNALPLSVNVWFKTNQTGPGAGYTFLQKYYWSSNNGWTAGFLTSTGVLQGTYAANSSSNEVVANSTRAVNDNNWHMATYVFSLINEQLYLDDTLVATVNWTGTAGASTSTRDMLIGKVDDPTNYWYLGYIDDISIYNRTLSSAEVQALYTGVVPTSCPTLAPVTTNASRCGAGSVTLTATGGTQYLWYNASSGGSIVNIGATYSTPSLSTTTTYYVSNFDSCESVRVPAVAYINNIDVNAGANQTISCGDSVLLNPTVTYSGTGTLAYNWSPTTDVISPTTLATYVKPSSTTTYTIQVTDGVCTSYGSTTITVNPASFGVAFTTNTQILYTPPFAFQFNNTTANLSDYNFTWYFGDGASEQSNNATVFHQYAQNGTYNITLVATSIATGCTETLYKSGYLYCAGGTACTQTCSITPTGPVSGCAGTSIVFTCNTVAGGTYQWNYNGAIISGDSTTTYTANASGNYSATIILSGCPVTSNVVTVTLNNPPAVPVITSKGSLIYCGGGKDTLTTTGGASSYLWSNGASTQSIVVTASGNYTVQVSDANGCKSQSAPYLVGASPLANPDICIVGVDSITGHNVVIWNKAVSTAINHYNVYSQGNVGNVFDLIGSVPYSSMSTFIDTGSYPAEQAYMYKLSAVDTCGAESALSSYHETIHLSINQGMGTTYNLLWNYYVGFTVPSYNIYRGTSPSNMTLIKTLASTLNSYTDLTPPAGYVYYQIEAVNPNPCNPTARVRNSSNSSSSRSNIATNNVTLGVHNYTNNSVNEIKVYPNPVTDILQIQTALQIKSIDVLDITGRLIYTTTAKTIDCSSFASGVYFIKATTSEGAVVKKFIKE